MSRRKGGNLSNSHKIFPDYMYNSKLVTKFINLLMYDGKKSIAENILYTSLNILKNKIKKSRLSLLEIAINNVKPIVEVKSRRVGGTTYQIPIEVRPKRGDTLAMRWIIFSARKRSKKKMFLKLADELLDAINKKGFAIKKRDDTHRIAESNKAFAHYRW